MGKEDLIVTAEPPDLLPWNKSYEDFFPLEILIKIRDDHPDAIIEAYCCGDAEIKSQVVVELLEHGNYRKAAVITRSFLKKRR